MYQPGGQRCRFREPLESALTAMLEQRLCQPAEGLTRTAGGLLEDCWTAELSARLAGECALGEGSVFGRSRERLKELIA